MTTELLGGLTGNTDMRHILYCCPPQRRNIWLSQGTISIAEAQIVSFDATGVIFATTAMTGVVHIGRQALLALSEDNTG